MKSRNLVLLYLGSMAKMTQMRGQFLDSLSVNLGRFWRTCLKSGDEPLERNSLLSNAPFLACSAPTSESRVIEADSVLVNI